MHSQVAHGRVRHQRLQPLSHAFRYRLSMLYLSLDEAPTLFSKRWLWSYNRPNLACVLREDHLRDGVEDLDCAVRDLIQAEQGVRPQGPVDLLTQPRYWGFAMNPISIYFVWSPDRSQLEWLLLEVHNTPWNEQHPYLLKPAPAQSGDLIDLRFAKAMHVSPFMDMDMHYRLRLRQRPGETLNLSLENRRNDQLLFKAGLDLRFSPATAAALAGLLWKTPFMSLRVAAGIYFQALRLRLKGVPYVPHPGRMQRHAAPHPSGVQE